MSYVHQIFISENNSYPSPTISKYMSIVKAHHDDFEYKFYNDDDIKSILALKFKDEVLWAYNTLVPFSYKVDLAKYCLLWLYGGWYYDVGVYPEFSIHFDSSVNGVFFTDSLDTSGGVWRIVASVIYTTPKREALMNAIEQIIQNCKDEYYGEDALHPTSTALLGKVMPKDYFDGKSMILGEGKMMAQENNVLRKALVLDGEVFSWYKDKGGDLGSLGAKGTNNYNYFWGNRCVYLKK
jgi:hypothetical protein